MNKKTKAALAGLAFLAGCEIGIAVQLAKMIHKFTVRESAMDAPLPDSAADDIDSAADDIPEDAEEAVTDVQDGVQSETPETDKENGESEETERPAVNDEEPSA